MSDSSPAAVALRMAAREWTDGSREPVRDCHDTDGLRRDRKLKKAALRYAAGMTKRGYSRDFKPHGETGKRYLLDEIPAGLWADVKAKCKRDGISIRAVILTLLKEWVSR